MSRLPAGLNKRFLKNSNLLFALILGGLLATGNLQTGNGQSIQPDHYPQPGGITFPLLGTVKPRPANQIQSSNWILGCETLDRDMADYEQYKAYLLPLGIRRLRMQAGWAKTEKVRGNYEWGWLDKIIDDATGRGLEPWLQLSYGNPIYPGGGGVNLSAGLPTSPQALAAWDRWVEALVKRYKGKVIEWEIWNEPNFGDNLINTPAMVADLNIRTAQIIKQLQPEAKISGLSMGHIDLDFAESFFKILHRKGKLHLFDNMTYHDYVYNPDANQDHVAQLRRVLDKYAPEVKLRQGENGCPSLVGAGRGALGDYPWSELTQAKWNTRRMLSDLGHDIECSILGIIDMNYSAVGSPITKLNVKGIIQSDSTRKAIRPKLAYYTMQHVAALFDYSLQRIPVSSTFNPKVTAPQGQVKYVKSTDRSLAVYGYRHKSSAKQLFTIWVDESIPTDSNQTRRVDFTFINAAIDQPVLVDILSGNVYQIPATQWRKEGNTHIFQNIPVYDAPIVLADQSLVTMR